MSPAVIEDLQLDLPGRDAGRGRDHLRGRAGTVANRSCLQKGDILIAVNGTPVATTKDLERVTRATAPMWEVTINRGGQQMTSVFGG